MKSTTKAAKGRGTKSTKKTTTKSAKPAAKIKTTKTGTTNRTTNDSAKKTDRKLSQIAAAVKVLKQSRKPLTCNQMVEKMTEKGLWQSPGGKTPEQTLYASILRDIQKHGDDSQFQKVDRGLFTLASK